MARAVEIITPDGEAVTVDAFIKPALLHLWGRGVVTLDSCAGHFPDYRAYIRIERNADFEEYAMRCQWETDTAPIMELDPAKAHELPPYTGGKKGVRLPAGIFRHTGRSAFFVFACNGRGEQSRILRGRFLRWLCEY